MIIGIIIGLAMYPLMIIVFTTLFKRCEDERYKNYWEEKENEQTKE